MNLKGNIISKLIIGFLVLLTVNFVVYSSQVALISRFTQWWLCEKKVNLSTCVYAGEWLLHVFTLILSALTHFILNRWAV